jgi:hypothetical protein
MVRVESEYRGSTDISLIRLGQRTDKDDSYAAMYRPHGDHTRPCRSVVSSGKCYNVRFTLLRERVILPAVIGILGRHRRRLHALYHDDARQLPDIVSQESTCGLIISLA